MVDSQVKGVSKLRHNLPRHLDRFVGREPEMNDVRQHLDATRLLTLTGAAGCGKTRLALEVALRAVDDYPDGIWLAELAPVSDPALVEHRLMSTLVLPGAAGRSALDVLGEYVGDKRLLLVLDNCEHVVDACAVLAQSLLRGCPSLRILTTSREALNIPGELVWRVPSLRLPDARQALSPEILATCEAVALFIDRARSVDPEFALTTINAESVAQICARLDGIPLAIELAAARTRLMPVDEILNRLNDRFRLLTSGSRTALPRQQTLRASIEWSYGLLTEPEQVLFRRMTVFAGSFSLDAVERVCAGQGLEATDMVDILGRLVEKSVLIADKEAGAVARFRLLETLRQYGNERLVEAVDADSTEHRYRDYVVALSEAAAAGMNGPGHADWLERLEDEQDNLRKVLSWCLVHDRNTAIELATVLGDFWFERGHLSEGRSWLDAVLPGTSGGPAPSARALMVAGNLAYHQADYAAAKSCFEASLNIWRQEGEQAGIGLALIALGMVAHGEGDLDGCRGPLEEGLRICRAAGDANGVSGGLFQLGMVAAQQGNVKEAELLGEEGLALSRTRGDLVGTFRALHTLAVVAYLQQDFLGLRTRSEEGLIISRNLRSPTGIALGLECFAVLAVTEGRHETALRLAGAAAGMRDSARAAISPVWLAAIAQALEPARHSLTSDAATMAWTEGRRLTMEQAVAYALDSLAEAKDQRKETRKRTDPLALTRREQLIAALVAEGLTNRQIAEKLFIAKRTAETHVQHIFNKLGFGTRAQIAAWAVREKLV